MEEDLNKKLCDALEAMQQELRDVCEEIREILCDFISDYKKRHSNLVFNEPSYRIKDVISFSEKIPRKNYIKAWDINEKTTPDECKKKIREELDDLLGFRINCYFSKDENDIYSSLLSQLGDNKNIKIIGGNSGPVKQKNGLDIYKLKCEYTSSNSAKQYLFELQIKCLIDNLWGEVDHEIAYKAKQYDYQLDSKSNLLKQVYKSLAASDAQLFEFYNSSYTEDDLINSLFFLYTHKEVNEKMKGKNCTIFYNKFFSIFGKKQDEVKDYVAKRMSGTGSFEKRVREFKSDANIDYFIKYIIEDKIGKDDIQMMVKEVQTIYGILFDFEEPNFLNIMVSAILQGARERSPKNGLADAEESDSGEPVFNEEQEEDEKDEKIYKGKEEKMRTHTYKDFDSIVNGIIRSKIISSIDDKNVIIRGFEFFCEIFY